MHTENSGPSRAVEIAQWEAMLRNESALLENPGRHHKTLIVHANALHRERVISSDDLSDLLEQADGALAYAIEALIDSRNGYEEALKDAEGRGLTSLFREMIALRNGDADEIAARLEEPE